MNAIKRLPDELEKANTFEPYWVYYGVNGWIKTTPLYINHKPHCFPGFMMANKQSGPSWFINIPGAPEELRPLPYPQNKPEKEGKYICHFKPYIVGCAPNNKDHWNENYWLVDDIDGNSDWQNAWNLVDFFINYPLEEEKMEEKKIQSIRVDYQSGFGAAIYIQRDTNEEFLRDICAYHGYDITKRQPEIAPCPNPDCGGECKIHGEFDGQYFIMCGNDCGYCAPIADTPEEAIEKHNQIAGKEK